MDIQEALEVLRTTSDVVNLIVCRPHDEEYRKLSPPTEAPRPPERSNLHCLPLDSNQTYVCGVSEKKLGNKSTGFHLRVEENYFTDNHFFKPLNEIVYFWRRIIVFLQ